MASRSRPDRAPEYQLEASGPGYRCRTGCFRSQSLSVAITTNDYSIGELSRQMIFQTWTGTDALETWVPASSISAVYGVRPLGASWDVQHGGEQCRASGLCSDELPGRREAQLRSCGFSSPGPWHAGRSRKAGECSLHWNLPGQLWYLWAQRQVSRMSPCAFVTASGSQRRRSPGTVASTPRRIDPPALRRSSELGHGSRRPWNRHGGRKALSALCVGAGGKSLV
jgi:hypothetical protein